MRGISPVGLPAAGRDELIRPIKMANSYTQIHLQLIFAVKHRASLINSAWKDKLYKYNTGIIQTQKFKNKIFRPCLLQAGLTGLGGIDIPATNDSIPTG